MVNLTHHLYIPEPIVPDMFQGQQVREEEMEVQREEVENVPDNRPRAQTLEYENGHRVVYMDDLDL